MTAALTPTQIAFMTQEAEAELDELRRWFASRTSGRAANPQGWDDRARLETELKGRLAWLADLAAG